MPDDPKPPAAVPTEIPPATARLEARIADLEKELRAIPKTDTEERQKLLGRIADLEKKLDVKPEAKTEPAAAPAKKSTCFWW